MLRRGSIAALAASALLAVGLAGGASDASAANTLDITTGFFQDVAAVGQTTGVYFTIENTDTDVTGLSFSDALPAGLVVAAADDLSNDCGGTVTDVAGSGSIALSGGALAGSDSTCTILVDVTATSAGAKSNTTGAVSSTETGPNAASNTAVLTVIDLPVTTSSFGPTSVKRGAASTLSFNLRNPNADAGFDNVGFDDTLPAGLTVAAAPNVTGTCLTSQRSNGFVVADPGSGSIELLGLGLDVSQSCTLSVDVVVGPTTAPGTLQDSTGPVDFSYDTGSGDPSAGSAPGATAALLVVTPPAIAAAFTPAMITAPGTGSLAITLTNPNAGALSGVAFTDALPTGLTIAAPSALSNTCGGTATAAAGSSSVTLTGGAMAGAGSCTLSVNVTGGTPGTFTATTSAVGSTEGGSGATAAATLTVNAPAPPPPTTMAATGAPPPPPPPPPPSNAFTFTNVVTNSDGSLTFDITVPGPGDINVLETLGHSSEIAGTRTLVPGPGRFVFSRLRKHAAAQGTIRKIRLVPNTRGTSAVRHHRHALRINLWITFTPAGGRGHLQHRLHLKLPGQ